MSALLVNRLADLVVTRKVAIPPVLPKVLIQLHESHGTRDKNKAIRGGDQVDLGSVAHPLIVVFLEKLRRDQLLLAAWSNRLLRGGEHTAHSHPRGGDSHVLYVASEHDQGGVLVLWDGMQEMTIDPKPGTLTVFSP